MLPDDMMDITHLTTEDAVLACARLHLWDGKSKLQEGLTAVGIAALYDAVIFGMHYYIVKHKRYASFVENTDFWDATNLFQALTRAGVFEDPLLFNRFSLIAERVLWEESYSFDVTAVLAEVENMLARLGVMPFKEAALLTQPQNL